MIEGHSPFVQALLGTLFTWGLTAVGAGLVFVFQSGQRKILDGSLGFAAGVMTAASYWSLLAPAIEMANDSGLYGEEGQWAFLPVAIGFSLGAVFVSATDAFMPQLGGDVVSLATMDGEAKFQKDGGESFQLYVQDDSAAISNERPAVTRNSVRQRGNPSELGPAPLGSLGGVYSYDNNYMVSPKPTATQPSSSVSWKRILLLIIAITIHNIPEGLAVGVGFGAIGKTKSATFENARNLAIGIGIQNFPEGLAVSLPLRGSGMSTLKSFWYGQLSGMVEPIAGMLGAVAVSVAEPVLPYALAFAAGAMIYVVVDDIIPEAQTCGNGKLASWGAIIGFVVMMSLDVGLG